MPWLTGSAIPTETKCRVIRVPDDPVFVAAVSGALLELTYPSNWEKYGSLTPEEQAQAFIDVYASYADSVCIEPETVIYPYTFYEPAALALALNQGTITKTFLAAAWGGMLAEPLPIAQNNGMAFLIMMSPGTWTIRIVGQRSTNYGIMTATLDGINMGTFDWYNAAAQNNIVAEFTATITDAYPVKQLHLEVLSKRAASTSYKLMVSGVYGFQNPETP